MLEKIEHYKNLIINFNPEIVTEVNDDWGKETKLTLLSSYNGFATPEDYRFALGDLERLFYSLFNYEGADKVQILKILKHSCQEIRTYLYSEKNEGYLSCRHAKMPVDFYGKIEGNRFYIDSFIEQAVKSIDTILVFVQDQLEISDLSAKVIDKNVKYTIAKKIGFLQSETGHTQSKVSKIYEVLRKKALIDCDKNTFNYWFRYDPNNDKPGVDIIAWYGAKNSLVYFIRNVIKYKSNPKKKDSGKWQHAHNIFKFYDRNVVEVDISKLVSDRSGDPKLDIKEALDKL